MTSSASAHRKRVAGWQVTLASFVSYAISNNIGFADRRHLGTLPVLLPLGVGAGDLSRIIFFYSTRRSWLGLAALGAGGHRSTPALTRWRMSACCGCWAWCCCSYRWPIWPPRSCSDGRSVPGAGVPVAVAAAGGAAGDASRRSTGRWPPPCCTRCCRRAGPTDALLGVFLGLSCWDWSAMSRAVSAMFETVVLVALGASTATVRSSHRLLYRFSTTCCPGSGTRHSARRRAAAAPP
jgi:hypothetical protein